MSNARITGLVLGGLAVLFAVVLLVVPVTASGSSCGSVIAPDNEESDFSGFAGQFDSINIERECSDARGSRLVLVGFLGIPGLGALFVSLTRSQTVVPT